MMIKTNCASCGGQIERDDERVLLAVMPLRYVTTEVEDHKVRLDVDRAVHYCASCAHRVEEFRMPNPLFVSEEERSARTKWFKEMEAEENAKDHKQDEELRKTLAEGDTHAFNAAFPTFQSPDDLRATAIPFADNVLSVGDADGIPLGPGSHAAGEFARRRKLLNFLNSPASRGMRSEIRKAARFWADGLSQQAIARKLNTDQSTVSRRIKSAQTMANAKR